MLCKYTIDMCTKNTVDYNKVSISITRTGSEVTENNLSTFKTDNFANFWIFAILDYLDFWVSCNFDFFTTFGTTVRSNLAMHLSDTPFIIRQPIRRPHLLERVYKPIRTPHWCGVLPLRALEIGCK